MNKDDQMMLMVEHWKKSHHIAKVRCCGTCVQSRDVGSNNSVRCLKISEDLEFYPRIFLVTKTCICSEFIPKP
jgi:hypothetical protein